MESFRLKYVFPITMKRKRKTAQTSIRTQKDRLRKVRLWIDLNFDVVLKEDSATGM
jgi:hypothetical protein